MATARTFPLSESTGWTIHFIERESRYWVAAIAGQKRNELFQAGTAAAWAWAKPAAFIRWFTDGERRYGKELWKLASAILKSSEIPTDYRHRKVWQFGLEVAMKIKGSQGYKRVEWVKIEHPFTAISATSDVHANHNEAQNSATVKPELLIVHGLGQYSFSDALFQDELLWLGEALSDFLGVELKIIYPTPQLQPPPETG